MSGLNHRPAPDDTSKLRARAHRRRQRSQPQILCLADPRRSGVIVTVDGADLAHVPALLQGAATLAAAAAFCLAGGVGPHDTAGAPTLPELCPAFAETSSCPDADRCDRIHATRATDLRPHRVTDTAATAAVYAPSTWPLFVVPHNADRPTMTVDATECFITKAVDTNGVVAATTGNRPLEHCAHFAVKGLCLFGADCSFVHHVPRGTVPDNGVIRQVSVQQHKPPPPAGKHVGTEGSSKPTAAAEAAASSSSASVPSDLRRRRWHNPYAQTPGWQGGTNDRAGP